MLPKILTSAFVRQRITQYKRFAYAHPNFCFAKTSFIPKTLYAMPKRQMKMRRKIRVYLDTSVISALFDERNPERKSLTEAFSAEIGNFETFISEITVAEIED